MSTRQGNQKSRARKPLAGTNSKAVGQGDSFDEAVRAAAAKLYRGPDDMANIEVIKTAGTFGGIAALRRFEVTVRRLP